MNATRSFSMLSLNGTQPPSPLPSDVAVCQFGSIFNNEALMYVSGILVTAFFLVSLVINTFLLVGLGESEAVSWQPRYKFLMNLIVSDLLQSVTLAPSFLYNLIYRHTLTFGVFCVVQFFTATLAIVISVLTVFFMVLERFVYICCGINYLVIMTNVRIYTCLSLIWLLALAVAITYIVIMMLGGPRFGHSIPGLVCEPGVMRVQMAFSLHFEMFDKVTMGTLLFLGLLVFSFSYSRMYQAARQALQPFRQDNKRAQCTVAFYLGIFLLQLFPCAFKFVTMYHEEAHYHLVLVLLLLVPPCVNPLAYGFRNKEVRRALQRFCGFRMTVRRPETDDNLHGLSLALKAPQTSPV